MKTKILFALLLIQAHALGQNFKNNCVYVIEGVISDGVSYEGVKHAIIKNKELGISGVSDENGYFSITFSLNFLDSNKIIGFEVFKKSYDIKKWWVRYNPIDSVLSDTSNKCLVWNSDLKMIRLSKSIAANEFGIASHRRINALEHGFSGIKTSYEEFVIETKRNDRLDSLKKNNENVLFELDGKYIICTNSMSLFFNDKNFRVYVNNKKVKLKEINNLLKRSTTIENNENRHKYYAEHGNSKLTVLYLESK